MGSRNQPDAPVRKVRVPLYFPVETRDLAAFSGGTPQKDQKLVNCFQETIGDQKWIVKRPGLFPYGSIGANALIATAILEASETQSFEPITNSYTTPGAADETVPTGASALTILGWAAGASGGHGTSVDPPNNGGGGGGGAGFKITLAIADTDWGLAISYYVAAKGEGTSSPSTDGEDGEDSIVTSSGLSFPDLNLVAGGGKKGLADGTAGAGGTATGGDTNVSGVAGLGTQGGNSATLDGTNGAGGNPGAQPGGGGNGTQGAPSKDGGDGRIDFLWS